mgnify:CR=1 FL=1
MTNNDNHSNHTLSTIREKEQDTIPFRIEFIKELLKDKMIDPMIDLESVKHFARYYVPDENFQHPWISPLYADLSNLSPVYIQVSTSEILLDDTRRFAEKAKQAGIEIEVEYWDKMVHVWQAFGAYLPEALQAIQKLGAYIEKKTAYTVCDMGILYVNPYGSEEKGPYIPVGVLPEKLQTELKRIIEEVRNERAN